MKSLSGVLAAAVFLLMLPLAILSQVIFGNGAETVIHLVGATGFFLISLSVFDFKLPSWINWFGRLAAAILAFIFLLQGIENIIQNELLAYVAFQMLGQRLEGWLVDLLIFWFVMLLLKDSQGKTRIFGFVVMSLVVCLELAGIILGFIGSSLEEKVPAFKILYLLTFLWFFFESRKNLTQSDKI